MDEHAKHTPGPWETRGPTRVYGNLQRDQNRTADLVADTVRAADASLIAAAPELLEALKAIDALQVMEINPSNYDHEIVCELNSNAVQAALIARAAIAKAEGLAPSSAEQVAQPIREDP